MGFGSHFRKVYILTKKIKKNKKKEKEEKEKIIFTPFKKSLFNISKKKFFMKALELIKKNYSQIQANLNKIVIEELNLQPKFNFKIPNPFKDRTDGVLLHKKGKLYYNQNNSPTTTVKKHKGHGPKSLLINKLFKCNYNIVYSHDILNLLQIQEAGELFGGEEFFIYIAQLKGFYNSDYQRMPTLQPVYNYTSQSISLIENNEYIDNAIVDQVFALLQAQEEIERIESNVEIIEENTLVPQELPKQEEVKVSPMVELKKIV